MSSHFRDYDTIRFSGEESLGTELLQGPDKTNVFEYKPDHAIAAVKQVLGLPFQPNLIYEHKPTNGEPPLTIYGLTAKQYVGEVVEFDGRVIHMTILETT